MCSHLLKLSCANLRKTKQMSVEWSKLQNHIWLSLDKHLTLPKVYSGRCLISTGRLITAFLKIDLRAWIIKDILFLYWVDNFSATKIRNISKMDQDVDFSDHVIRLRIQWIVGLHDNYWINLIHKTNSTT